MALNLWGGLVPTPEEDDLDTTLEALREYQREHLVDMDEPRHFAIAQPPRPTALALKFHSHAARQPQRRAFLCRKSVTDAGDSRHLGTGFRHTSDGSRQGGRCIRKPLA